MSRVLFEGTIRRRDNLFYIVEKNRNNDEAWVSLHVVEAVLMENEGKKIRIEVIE